MKIRALSLIAASTLALSAAVAMADDTNKNDPKTDTNDKSMNDKSMNDKSASSEKLSAGDLKIVSHLHHVNQMEIEMGTAAQKSGTPKIKSYATTLVNDHQTADRELTAFAKQHKVTAIPAEKPESDMDKQDQKDMQSQAAHLKTLKGAAFDKEFLTMMIAGHEKELAGIDATASSASNPDLQNMLKDAKPVFQRHADQARDLQKGPQASTEAPAETTPASR